jgi:hypothetical protein
MTAAVAAVLAPAVPALAAEQPATTARAQSVVPASWHLYRNYVSLDTCIAVGEDKVYSHQWQDWECHYPASGYNLWGLY